MVWFSALGESMLATQRITVSRVAAALKPPKRLLGLDVGSTYIGVALSDPTNAVALPLTVVYRKKLSTTHRPSQLSIRTVAASIQSLILEHNVVGLIVGSPTPVPGYAGSRQLFPRITVCVFRSINSGG
jgi:hypothetical protein